MELLTNEQLINLTEEYANVIVKSMDMDYLIHFAYESVMDRLRQMGQEDLLREIETGFPELLEDFVAENLTSEE